MIDFFFFWSTPSWVDAVAFARAHTNKHSSGAVARAYDGFDGGDGVGRSNRKWSWMIYILLLIRICFLRVLHRCRC